MARVCSLTNAWIRGESSMREGDTLSAAWGREWIEGELSAEGEETGEFSRLEMLAGPWAD